MNPVGGTVQVLLVEDDRDDAAILEELLREWPLHRFALSVAPDLAHAADRLRDGSFDAIVTDLGLGASQGLTTLEAVRRLAGPIPVIVLTGLNGDSLGLKAVEMGAQAHLEKDGLDGRQAAQVILHAIQRGAILRDLEAARRKAEATQAARTQFFATLSHELRQPLNGILGYVQLLEMAAEADAKDRRLDYCSAIRHSADLMLCLINDILEYAQAEAGHLTLERQAVDLVATLQEAAIAIAPEAGRRQVQILLPDGEGPAARVCADGRRLLQVLLNLLSNAVRFSPEGARVIVSPAEAGSLLGWTIADAGPGMDAAEIAVALEPFGQVYKNSGGTGLGLPFCQRIIDLHTGRLEIDSVHGEGTRVTVLLPKATPPHDAPNQSSTSEASLA